jgi:hypothetical protein
VVTVVTAALEGGGVGERAEVGGAVALPQPARAAAASTSTPTPGRRDPMASVWYPAAPPAAWGNARSGGSSVGAAADSHPRQARGDW